LATLLAASRKTRTLASSMVSASVGWRWFRIYSVVFVVAHLDGQTSTMPPTRQCPQRTQ
jgi:hypothetical protein